MGTKTPLTVGDYAALDEPEGVRYELSEGELIVTPSSSAFHNEIRDDFNVQLRGFAKSHKLGLVTSETTARNIGMTPSSKRRHRRTCVQSTKG